MLIVPRISAPLVRRLSRLGTAPAAGVVSLHEMTARRHKRQRGKLSRDTGRSMERGVVYVRPSTA